MAKKQTLIEQTRSVVKALESGDVANSVHGWSNTTQGPVFTATGHTMGRRLVVDVEHRRYKVLRRRGTSWANAIDWQQDPRYQETKTGLQTLVKDALAAVHSIRPSRR
jgi:hypothetical protein